MPRIVRFVVPGDDPTPRYGVLDGAQVSVLEPHPFAPHDLTGEQVDVADIRLLAPVIPSKIVCVGQNYADHVSEMGGGDVPDEPLLFLKPSSSVIGPGEPIRIPDDLSNEVHHEAELAVVIGAIVSMATPEQAARAVYGFTCANDVTARDLQRAEPQWTRGKGFDSFCPLGPAISTDIDPHDVAVRCFVDGELRQDGRTSELVHDVPSIVAYVSQVMTLIPGDVVLTGTPAGVGPITHGQRVRVEVEGIGALENPVVDRTRLSAAVERVAAGGPAS